MNQLRSLLALNANRDENGKNEAKESKSSIHSSASQLHHSKCLAVRATTAAPNKMMVSFSAINLQPSVHRQHKDSQLPCLVAAADTADASSQSIHLDLPSSDALATANTMTFTDFDILASSDISMSSNYRGDLPLSSACDHHSNNNNTTNSSFSSHSHSHLHSHNKESEVCDVEDHAAAAVRMFASNDYRFMYQISAGAFGVVQKQFHLASCQIVAVKQCRSSHADAMRSFQKEIQFLEDTKACPFIIDMVEYGSTDAYGLHMCMALQYMNMGSLQQHRSILSTHTLPRIRHICQAVLSALQYMHRKLLVHNDVKPANILFADNGDVKLADFGCVQRMKDETTPLTSVRGTLYFQSYEKRFASPIRYDTKSDLYSLGITVCDLLHEESGANHEGVPFKIPDEVLLTFTNDDAFMDFLHKCLDRNRFQRWSAAQLLTHPFLNANEHKFDDGDEDDAENRLCDLDDLEFMVQALIEYYSHYPRSMDCTLATQQQTPIDGVWTDEARLKNMAKYSGFSVDYVERFITRAVVTQTNQYLKY